MKLRLPATLLLSFTAWPQATLAQSALEPYQLVRSYQRIQDQIVTGDAAAISMQRALFKEVTNGLNDSAQNAKVDERNLRAVLSFAAAGGGPQILKPYRDAFAQKADMRTLASKIFMYNGKNATQVFTYIDVSTLDPLLGATLALLRGQGAPTRQLQIKDLTYARIKAPGTLIEEGALRRLIQVYRLEGDQDKFYNTSRRYFKTYSRSPFAGQFVNEFILGVIALDDKRSRQHLVDMMTYMDPAIQKDIRSRIVRLATVNRRKELFDTVSSLTQKPIEMNSKTPVNSVFDETVLRAYNKMDSLTPETAKGVLEELKKINPDNLRPENKRLRITAIQLIEKLYKQITPQPTPLTQYPVASSTDIVQPDNEETTDTNPNADLVQSIRDELKATDMLLENLND